MNIDQIVNDLLGLARVLELAALLPIPGKHLLPAAAEALRDLAANRARLEAIFQTVNTAVDFIQQVIDFLRGTGHEAAAAYLGTSTHPEATA